MDRRPSRQERQSDDRRADGITAGLAFIIVLGAIAIYFFVTATPDKPVVPTISSNPIECEQVIALEKLTGLVKRRAAPTRLDVDEALWTGMATEQKRIVLDHLACSAFDGRSLAQLGPQEAVTVYGSASGRLLSRAGATGIVSR